MAAEQIWWGAGRAGTKSHGGESGGRGVVYTAFIAGARGLWDWERGKEGTGRILGVEASSVVNSRRCPSARGFADNTVGAFGLCGGGNMKVSTFDDCYNMFLMMYSSLELAELIFFQLLLNSVKRKRLAWIKESLVHSMTYLYHRA